MPPARSIQRHLPLSHLSYHVLLVLFGTRLHGYGIIKEAFERTGGQMDIETGTLYAAIKRLKDDGLIETARAPRGMEKDPRRRYYQLTTFGQKVLVAESERLARLVGVAREKRLVGDIAGLEIGRG